MQEYSQSAVNWRAIKKIYAQGSKRVFSPKPNRTIGTEKSQNKFSIEQIERYVEQVIGDVNEQYNILFANLQKETNEMLESMSTRVQSLQQEIKALKQQKEEWNKNSSSIYKNQIQIQQFEQEHSLIGIEQSQQEESLLDSAHKQSTKCLQQKNMSKTKKKNYQMTKSSSNCYKKLFQDTQMKTQTSQFMQPLSNKQSTTFFDYCARDMKEQLNNLKHFIQEANHIRLQDYPFRARGISQIYLSSHVKSIEVNGSENEVGHLKNQNDQLRNSIKILKDRLVDYSKQLRQIKWLLLKCISNDQTKECQQ